jgi:hypothetical protein
VANNNSARISVIRSYTLSENRHVGMQRIRTSIAIKAWELVIHARTQSPDLRVSTRWIDQSLVVSSAVCNRCKAGSHTKVYYAVCRGEARENSKGCRGLYGCLVFYFRGYKHDKNEGLITDFSVWTGCLVTQQHQHSFAPGCVCVCVSVSTIVLSKALKNK